MSNTETKTDTGNHIQLKPSDEIWMAGLMSEPSRLDLSPERLAEINSIITRGSVDLRDVSDPYKHEEVLRARQEFFEGVLGWNKDNENPMSRAYKVIGNINTPDRLLMPSSVIAMARQCDAYGLDIRKIARYAPTALAHDPAKIRMAYDHLYDLGLDSQYVINAQPSVLASRVEKFDNRMADIQDLGLDPIKIINTTPSVLAYSKQGLTEKVNALTHLGINAPKIIEAFPGVLSFNPRSFSNKIYALMRYGYVGEDNQFPDDDPTFLKKFCIIPNESLLLYLDWADSQGIKAHDVRFLPDRAAKYMEELGAKTGVTRKELFKDRYMRGLPAKMGYIATLQASRSGLIKEHEWPHQTFPRTKNNMVMLS